MNISRDLIAKDQVEAVTGSPIVLKLNTSDDIAETRKLVRLFSSKTDDSVFGKLVKVSENVSVLIYRPRKATSGASLPVIYYIHGGGYVSGSADLYDNEHQQRADALDCVVIAVEYRLAPENPYPAALDDCAAGISWVHDHAQDLDIDTSRITVMGESAGGGLSAALCLYLRDKSELHPKNQILLFPMMDYKTSENPEDFENKYVGEYVWTHNVNYLGWKYYLGSASLPQNELQYYSAAYASSLSSLPPTYIAVGSLDLLMDESLIYASRLSAAGIPISLDLVAGAVHGFNFLPGETASTFNDCLLQHLKRVL